MSENWQNTTSDRGFRLMAFSSSAEVRLGILIGILILYLLIILSNILVIVLVCLAPQLHTPMYFFLCNLSVQDIVYVSAILPKLMDITITGDTYISFTACFLQRLVFILCVDTEYFLLTSMACDRYVAICIPLRYSLIMNKRLCALLASISWILGIVNALRYSFLFSNLSLCNIQEIDHFFCDLKTMLQLSCSDTTNFITMMSIECVVFGFLPTVLIITSYAFIISTILKIRSSATRLKVFFSCSSHLTTVILFGGTSLILYLKPGTEHSHEQDKILSLLYIAVVPLLNPLVYSLRNKDILNALKVWRGLCKKLLISVIGTLKNISTK
ncbi:olfactory receptor 2G3-like [Rhinophrynus dorsalis]